MCNTTFLEHKIPITIKCYILITFIRLFSQEAILTIRVEVFVTMKVHIAVFWVTTLCCTLDG